MLTPIKPGKPSGFSLMEILVVLVILGLSTAVIMPSSARMLDQATSHAVFFEFQREVSDLRRQANRTGTAASVVDPATPLPLPEGAHIVPLRAPWRYTVAPALKIAEGGVCAPASVNLIKDDIIVMALQSDGSTCRFIRLQTGVRLPSRPSSQR
ncbi:type II secretion system protein [Brevundimonas sp. DC300-4]|uniref:type II secretion system protein n=1 Tax=Brevundimonas sp. DC300-4 TaxID=2804594 RepID=UPI003CEC1722